jgi:CRP-like cAMP-binding protein
MPQRERWRRKLLSALRGEVPERDIDRLLAGAVVERFRRHAVLYSVGDVSEQIYLLLSGVIALSLAGAGGTRGMVQLLGPGTFFGFCAFRPDRERQFHAEAFTDVEVAALSRDHFTSVLTGMAPRGHTALLARHAEALLRLARRQLALVSLPVRERLLAVLDELGRDFGVRDARGVIIDLRVTQETLGALAGASRQRVSVALAQLARAGFVSHDARRIVLRRTGATGGGTRPRSGRHPSAADSAGR